MKKTLLILICVSGSFACQHRSPLSDVEVSDPDIISPVIQLERSIDNRGNESNTFSVFLNDDNGNSIELQKGGVSLNGNKCSARTNGWGNNPAPYYSLDQFNLADNSLYNFQITLADDVVYPCTINSPQFLLNELNVPEYFNMENDLEISWSRLISDPSTKYFIQVEGNQIQRQYKLSSSEVNNGRYTFSSSELYRFVSERRDDLEISLHAKTIGKVNPKFNGGEIELNQSISKQITLDEGDNPTDATNEVKVTPNETVMKEAPAAVRPEKEDKKDDGIHWSPIILLLGLGGLIGFGISKIGKNKK